MDLISKLNNIINKKIERLFFIVWPPYGELDKTQIDISAGYVFQDELDSLFIVSTDKDDLSTPYIENQQIPSKYFKWSDFELRMNKWINCDDNMEFDTEYYEVTNTVKFNSISGNQIRNIELVKVSNDESPIGVKIIFNDDYILSTPIIDGNTIESKEFNKNDNLKNFSSLGEIEFISINSTPPDGASVK